MEVCIITFALMLIIPLISTIRLNVTYRSCLKRDNGKGLTGYDVAKKILDSNGLGDIYIVETAGTMTDAYESGRRVLRLSHDVFHGTSVAAAAIAAHEAGHAVQDAKDYSWFRVRHTIAPSVQLGEKASYIILIVGLILGIINLVYIGVALMIFGLIFELVTLPCELDASKRGYALIEEYDLIDEENKPYVSKMLRAAAFTYIAAILTTLAQMAYYIARYSGRRR